jgi:anti-anti-sigma factor
MSSAVAVSAVTPSHRIIVEPVPVELVTGTRQTFKLKLLDHIERGCHVIVDCGKATYIDSAGLGVLLSLQKKFHDASRRLVLSGLNEDLTTLLELTKLDGILAVRATVAEARALIEGVG